MEYRVLGKTGIKVSVIGLGGEGFENKTYKECEEIIDEALKNGINIIDIYNSNPDVRSHVGQALSKHKRESFVVEGHLGSMWENGQYRRTRNMEEVKKAYDDFFTRMQLEYVDVGMIHYVDDEKDFDSVFHGEMMEYALALKNEGKIKHIGLSTHNPDIALKAVEDGRVEVMLFSINAAYDMLPASEDVDVLFDESTFDRDYSGIDPKRERLYQLCQSNGVALTVMKGYGAGVLLNEKQSPFKQAMRPEQCIHYCLNRPAVASVIVGIASLEELQAALYYTKASDDQKDYTDILANAPRTTFNGQCMYCGHCAPCTKKIDVALVNKYLDLAKIQKEVPETLKDHYRLLSYHASDCIECRACEKNCPFGVEIIKKMKEAVKLFGY